MKNVSLSHVVALLEQIAPPELAAEWDNVGLLWSPTRARPVSRILLTIDFTGRVVKEALASKTDLVVAYHPPIFDPIRQLRTDVAAENVILTSIEAGMALYSPHTALDAAPGGVNDWLADGLGPSMRQSIERPRAPVPVSHEPGADAIEAAVTGQGRLVTLRRPTSLQALIRRVKKHVGIQRLRVASAPPHLVGKSLTRVALCAGAGGDVLRGVDAELLITGEMRHHDVREAVEEGRSVILTDHTHTERGFLPILKERLKGELGRGVRIQVSAEDADPLIVV